MPIWQSPGLILRLLSSDELWHDVKLTGVIKGKKRGTLEPGDTRGILPQTAFLQLGSRILLNRVVPVLDSWSEREGVKGLVLGVGKGGQTQDISFMLDQCL